MTTRFSARRTFGERLRLTLLVLSPFLVLGLLFLWIQLALGYL